MALKMAAKRYTQRTEGEKLRDALIGRLSMVGYYYDQYKTELERMLNHRASRLESGSVDIQPARVPAPMIRGEFYDVDLYDRDRKLLDTHFMQVYFSQMKNLSSDISEQQAQGSARKLKEINYRKRHMAFWNETPGIVSPRLIGVEKSENQGKNPDYAVAILTQKWEGNSHHVDMMTMNLRVATIIEQLGRSDKFLSPHLRDKLEQEKKDLEDKIEEVTLSPLYMVNSIAVFGTDALAKINLYRDTPKHDRDFYRIKGMDYLKQAYRWHCKVNPQKEVNMEEVLDNFADFLDVVLPRLTERDKLVYAQGDEFLYHFQFHETEGDSIVSGIFDADHACFNRLERSRNKIVLDPLLDLTYEQRHRAFDAADMDLREKLSRTETGSHSRMRLAHIMQGECSLKLDADLIGIYEAVCSIGRASLDDIINKRHSLTRESRVTEYSNPYINLKFPENINRIIPLGLSPRNKIKIVTKNLKETVKKMLAGETPYGSLSGIEYEALVKFANVLSKFDIPESTNEDPAEQLDYLPSLDHEDPVSEDPEYKKG